MGFRNKVNLKTTLSLIIAMAVFCTAGILIPSKDWVLKILQNVFSSDLLTLGFAAFTVLPCFFYYWLVAIPSGSDKLSKGILRPLSFGPIFNATKTALGYFGVAYTFQKVLAFLVLPALRGSFPSIGLSVSDYTLIGITTTFAFVWVAINVKSMIVAICRKEYSSEVSPAIKTENESQNLPTVL